MEQEQIKWLNGIKGLACVPVFAGHYKAYFSVMPLFDIASKIKLFGSAVWNGNFAVNLYFIISAYVISNYIFSPKMNYQELSKKMVKRYLRFALPLLVLYEFIYILQKNHLFFNSEVGALLGTSEYLGRNFATNYTQLKVIYDAFIGTLFLNIYDFNDVLWMMQIMFLGYYFAILAALFMRWQQGHSKCGIVICGIVLGILLITDSYYSQILFGVMLSYLNANALNVNKFFRKTLGVLSFLLVIIGLLFDASCGWLAQLGTKLPFDVLGQFYIYNKAGAMLFMLGINYSSKIKKILSSKIFGIMNKVSFPVFMYHNVIVGSLGCFTFLLLYNRGVALEVTHRCTFAMCLIGLVCVSAIYVCFVEKIISRIIDKIMCLCQR